MGFRVQNSRHIHDRHNNSIGTVPLIRIRCFHLKYTKVISLNHQITAALKSASHHNIVDSKGIEEYTTKKLTRINLDVSNIQR